MQKHNLLIFVFIVFLLFSCSQDEPVPSDFTPVKIPEDFAGMCHSGYSTDSPDGDMGYGVLNEMGVVWIHRDFTWNAINPSDGVWNYSGYDDYVARGNTGGKKILGMLLYNANWVTTERRIQSHQIEYFTNYAVETVKRYNGKNGHGKVDAWLIWNEPDITRFWTGTQEEFFALTKATAEAIRELDAAEETHTTLLGGVFTSTVSEDWITGFFEYENGAIKSSIDGVAFHPYGPIPGSSANVFNWFKEKVTPYGFADKIWLNEMGYPTYPEKGPIPSGRYGTDQWEGDMPKVVVQTFTLLATAGARNLTWYHLSDGADRNMSDSEAWFGLVWRKSATEWVKKGGYWGYALCAKNLPGKTYSEFNISGLPDDIKTYYFKGDDSRRTLIAWSVVPLVSREITLTLGGSNHKLWDVETGESVNAEKTGKYTMLPVYGDQPQNILFLTWNE